MRNSTFPRQRAFSLVEVLIAMTLSVAVAGMAMSFLVEGTRASLRASGKMTNDVSQWSISSRLQLDSKLANGAAIYSSLDDGALTQDLRRKAGNRGQLLILSSSVNQNNASAATYQRVTGYLYKPTTRTLLRFDHEVASTQQNDSLETIIKNNKASFKMQTVATTIDSLDPAGPFACRDTGNTNAATALFRLNQGVASLFTQNSIVIEVSFLIRG